MEDFPSLCESCLGSNPYVRMQRHADGRTCKMCVRSYTAYRWRPGRGESYKRTEVCKDCSLMKNICQACILDLKFGLPSQLRDAVLNSNESSSGYLHESDVSRDYKIQQFVSEKASFDVSNEVDAQAEKLLKLVRAAASSRDEGKALRLINEATTRIRQSRSELDSGLLKSLPPPTELLMAKDDHKTVAVSSNNASSECKREKKRKRSAASSSMTDLVHPPPRPEGPPPAWAFKSNNTNLATATKK